jgi:hypothetical protein
LHKSLRLDGLASVEESATKSKVKEEVEMVIERDPSWHCAACLDAEKRMHKVFGAQHLDLLRHALRPQPAQQRRSA